jgi:hypothetical protein
VALDTIKQTNNELLGAIHPTKIYFRFAQKRFNEQSTNHPCFGVQRYIPDRDLENNLLSIHELGTWG